MDARTRPDFVIIARTDARAVEGLEQALDRARLYREAGADALFIEAVTSEDEAAEAARAFPDVPLLFNWAEGGKTPPISLDRLRELGYRIVIFPISTLLAATAAMRRVLGRSPGPGPRPGFSLTCRRSGISWTSSGCRRCVRQSSGTAPSLAESEPPAGPVQPGPGSQPANTLPATPDSLASRRTISRPCTRPSGADGRHGPPSSATSSQT